MIFYTHNLPLNSNSLQHKIISTYQREITNAHVQNSNHLGRRLSKDKITLLILKVWDRFHFNPLNLRFFILVHQVSYRFQNGHSHPSSFSFWSIKFNSIFKLEWPFKKWSQTWWNPQPSQKKKKNLKLKGPFWKLIKLGRSKWKISNLRDKNKNHHKLLRTKKKILKLKRPFWKLVKLGRSKWKISNLRDQNKNYPKL